MGFVVKFSGIAARGEEAGQSSDRCIMLHDEFLAARPLRYVTQEAGEDGEWDEAGRPSNYKHMVLICLDR